MADKKTILVVDDESDIRTVLLMRLSSAGYNTIEAGNGRDAIKLAKEKSPDLIIMDIMMPEMDGMSTSQQLKESNITKNIPIIFLTGLQDKDSEPKKGDNIIFPKPYDSKELLAAVKSILGK